MKIRFNKTFSKQFEKLRPKTRAAFMARLDVWRKNPAAPNLRVHELRGQYQSCFSFNVTGNVRAIYRIDEDIVEFVTIGTHSELYGK